MSEYKKVIDQVVAKSGLSGAEKERLQEEMQAHFEDANKDYLTKGKSEEDVLEDFGDPKLVGQQVRIVKKRWEKIPILGDLIYYPLFRWAFSLGITELILVFISPLFFFFPLLTWEDLKAGDSDWATITLSILMFIIPLGIVAVRGIRINKVIHQLADLLFLMLLSLVPIVSVLMIIYIPDMVMRSGDNSGFYFTIQLIGLILFNIVYFISYLIGKLIKKYV